MFRLPRSFRACRVAFIIAVAWIVALVCFLDQWKTALSTSSSSRTSTFILLAAGILVSLGLLFWVENVKPESRWGRITSFIELLLFNVTLSVVLLELSLRTYSLVTNNPFTLPKNLKDVALVNERRTEKMQQMLLGFPFNSDGFFDTEFRRPKPDNVFRIVVLGDSFGVGAVPYSHHYLTLLEQELEDLVPGKQIEVCNLGLSRTGPQHYLSLFQQIGHSLQPDLVLVGFFLGNDFNADAVEDSFSSPWDALMIYRVPTRIYRMSQANTDYLEWVPTDEEPKLIVPDYVGDWRLEKPTMPRDYFLQVQSQRARIFDKARDDAMYENACTYLRQIAREARTITGKPLVLVIIPDENQVNAALRADVDTWMQEKASQDSAHVAWDLEKPNRFLANKFDTDEIVVVDLLPALRRAEAELGRTYHLQNTHWNANGNRIAGEELGRILIEKWQQITD